MGKYSVNISQSGNQATSLVGDRAQLIANFSPASSVQDLTKLLYAIRTELEHLDIPADVKDEANVEVERAIIQTKKETPDKATLLESLKNVAEVVKNASTIALGVGQFWTLIRKATEWVM